MGTIAATLMWAMALAAAFVQEREANQHHERRVAAVANGDVDKAIAEFDEAIRFDPKFVEALSSRGIARHSKADLDRAIVDYTEAIRLHDKNRVVLCNRSSAWIEKKEYKKAVADGDAATRLDADWLSPFGCGRSHGQR